MEDYLNKRIIQGIHRLSIEYIDLGICLYKQGKQSEALVFYEVGLRLEILCAEHAVKYNFPEPTKSVLIKSALEMAKTINDTQAIKKINKLKDEKATNN